MPYRDLVVQDKPIYDCVTRIKKDMFEFHMIQPGYSYPRQVMRDLVGLIQFHDAYRAAERETAEAAKAKASEKAKAKALEKDGKDSESKSKKKKKVRRYRSLPVPS